MSLNFFKNYQRIIMNELLYHSREIATSLIVVSIISDNFLIFVIKSNFIIFQNSSLWKYLSAISQVFLSQASFIYLYKYYFVNVRTRIFLNFFSYKSRERAKIYFVTRILQCILVSILNMSSRYHLERFNYFHDPHCYILLSL
jgi:hypothetical protein